MCLEIKQDYYVIFRNSNHWTGRMLKPGFGHVFLLINDGFNWTIINPTHDLMVFSILPYEPTESVIETMLDDTHTTIKLKICGNIDANTSFNILNPINCVTAVKYFLGIRRIIYTPFSLYKYLIKVERGILTDKSILTIELIGDNHEL